jgi:DNA-binding transcriptional MocR family regulator
MGRARYQAIVAALAADIRAGRLAPGARLPTHRELAARHGIAVVTASRVYAELAAMGLISGETGRGTFVRDTELPPGHGVDQPEPTDGSVDLNFNYPALSGQAELLRKGLRQLASQGDLDSLLRYQPHGGRATERAVVARHLRRSGVTVGADQVVIVDGAQHGLATVAMALLEPGDVVAVDALTYPGFKALAHTLRLQLAPIPAAGDGPDLDALQRICARRRVSAVYTMPTLHNPLGWVTPQRSRLQLVKIVRAHGLLLIEDGAYAYLAEQPPSPLAALAPESTVYVSGLSKSVATGLRFGYVAAPKRHVAALERVMRATTWNTPALITALCTGWIADGTVARLELEKRADARHRQAIAREVLADFPLIGHPNSYFGWLPLAEGFRADQLAARLNDARIAVSTAEPFSTAKTTPQAVRLALGSVPTDVLRQALTKVRTALTA